MQLLVILNTRCILRQLMLSSIFINRREHGSRSLKVHKCPLLAHRCHLSVGARGHNSLFITWLCSICRLIEQRLASH